MGAGEEGAHLGGDVEGAVGDVQVPDDKDEAGGHGRGGDGAIVGVGKVVSDPEACVQALGFMA